MRKAKQRRTKIGIRPGVRILTMLSRLNYRAWYAIAEFVDNSIQSYVDTKSEIRKTDGRDAKLKIKIKYDGNLRTLSVEDNAGGISIKDFARAFRAAEVPPDISGLHEFGMGMKAAACWFSPLWRVETKHLGEDRVRSIEFDLRKISNDSIEELEIDETKASKDTHFTYIELKNLHRPLNTKTIDKIRRHLASIYREFLRDGVIEIDFNGKIEFEDPTVLKSPKWDDEKGKDVLWKVEVDEKISARKHISGFIAIRETGSTAEAGLALFRKKRLIQGSFDEPWRPQKIFGSPNSYMSQRIFGELHLEGFDVTHTKDGFFLEDDEETVVDRLHAKITKKNMNLIEQSQEYRSLSKPEDLKPRAERALQKIEKKLNKSAMKKTIGKQTKSPQFDSPSKPAPKSDTAATKVTYSLDFKNEPWELEVELSYSKSARELFQIIDDSRLKNRPRHIRIAVFAYHPFFVEHIETDQNNIEAAFKIAMAFCIAEVTARDAGVAKAVLVRTNFNELLGKGWSNG